MELCFTSPTIQGIVAAFCIFELMRRYLIYLLLMTMLATVACSRKTGCPSYDNKTGEYSIKDKRKTRSGLFPRNMR